MGEVRNGSDMGARDRQEPGGRGSVGMPQGFWVPWTSSAPSPGLLLTHQQWRSTLGRKEGTLEPTFAQSSESLECRSGPWSWSCDENFLLSPDQSRS